MESSIKAGALDVDVGLNSVKLTFDERIGKSNLRVMDIRGKSLNWDRIITGKEVLLVNINGFPLKRASIYSVFGTVEDTEGNVRAILITFLNR